MITNTNQEENEHTSKKKFQKIKKIFEDYEDPKNAISMSSYMKNKFHFFGIATPLRKKLYKHFLKEENENETIDWKFLQLCYQDEHREFQYLVTDYLDLMKKKLAYDDIKYINQFMKLKSWWDTTDHYIQIIGCIGLSDNRVNDLMLEWSLDENIWIRRASILHQILRKDKTNTELLEKIILNNFGSDEFFINKAIGWILRDYSKTNPSWVSQFIKKYSNQMAPLSIKEASKYI